MDLKLQPGATVFFRYHRPAFDLVIKRLRFVPFAAGTMMLVLLVLSMVFSRLAPSTGH